MTREEWRDWLNKYPDDPPACPHGVMAGPCTACQRKEPPALAPDRAALVAEIEAFFRKWPSLANSTGDWSMLQRARDMIVADDKIKADAYANIGGHERRAEEDAERIAELEAKCSALEAALGRVRDRTRFSSETVGRDCHVIATRAVGDAALASQPPEGDKQ